MFIHCNSDGNVDIVVVKIVEDLLSCGSDVSLKRFASLFSVKFTLGEIENRPEQFRFYGLNILQHDNFSCSIGGDKKLLAIELYTISRVCLRFHHDEMKTIELSSFMSVNSSIGWLGMLLYCVLFKLRTCRRSSMTPVFMHFFTKSLSSSL